MFGNKGLFQNLEDLFNYVGLNGKNANEIVDDKTIKKESVFYYSPGFSGIIALAEPRDASII